MVRIETTAMMETAQNNTNYNMRQLYIILVLSRDVTYSNCTRDERIAYTNNKPSTPCYILTGTLGYGTRTRKPLA